MSLTLARLKEELALLEAALEWSRNPPVDTPLYIKDHIKITAVEKWELERESHKWAIQQIEVYGAYAIQRVLSTGFLTVDNPEWSYEPDKHWWMIRGHFICKEIELSNIDSVIGVALKAKD